MKSSVLVELLQSRLLECWSSLQEKQCQVFQPFRLLQATIVLSNTFWSTGALLPERTPFVEWLEITHPEMHAAHLTLALVLFGAANHRLHTISA